MTAHTQFMNRAGNAIMAHLAGSQTKRILLVDDEPEILVTFRHLFRMAQLADCRLDTAESVNQAMAMVATNCYDLCILDYRLGDGTAADLVKLWRDYGYEIPFMCISGYPDVDREMRALGSVAFVCKGDMDAATLADGIRLALGDFWKRRQLLAA